MRIHRVQIENFRNFSKVDVLLGNQMVIVGENKIGKTNFLYALRLILDTSLPDSSRQLQESDFWDGLPRPIKKHRIKISIDLTDFENSTDLKAILGDYLVDKNPLVARLTYEFYPVVREGKELDLSSYEFIIYGGDRQENKIGYDVRKRIPFEILHALRDAESDLSTWRKSPLKPLIDNAISKINRSELEELAVEISTATNSLKDQEEIKNLAFNINSQLINIVGSTHAVEMSLGFSPSDPDKLYRAIRMFIDGGSRGIGEASLGSANLIYLVLKSLELEYLVNENTRDHTFLAIEEPEAHLHPHIQRLIYRYLLQNKHPITMEKISNNNVTNILTTHSPHIISVAPLQSIVLLKQSSDAGTEILSTAHIDLTDKDIEDLERYINVTRGELLFSKGVILVEGDAEEFLMPTLAKLLEFDLDELGITICSVSGTNFMPYVKLLGEKCLNVPFAILTDLDPKEDGNNLGNSRVSKLFFEIMDIDEEDSQYPLEEILQLAPTLGIFMNDYTLEIDLFKSGRHVSMCNTIIELTENGAARKRAIKWKKDKIFNNNEERFLKDIEEIGKGRFAQRLASNLQHNNKSIPSYILEALKYVAERI